MKKGNHKAELTEADELLKRFKSLNRKSHTVGLSFTEIIEFDQLKKQIAFKKKQEALLVEIMKSDEQAGLYE